MPLVHVHLLGNVKILHVCSAGTQRCMKRGSLIDRGCWAEVVRGQCVSIEVIEAEGRSRRVWGCRPEIPPRRAAGGRQICLDADRTAGKEG